MAITPLYNNGIITIDWTEENKSAYGSYPVIWAYFNNQMQSATPVLDDNDNPSLVTIDLGIDLSTLVQLIFAKYKKQTIVELSPAQIQSGISFSNNVTVEADNGALSIFWNSALLKKHGKYPFMTAYFNGQSQVLTPVPNNMSNPAMIKVNLGTIPTDTTRLIII